MLGLRLGIDILLRVARLVFLFLPCVHYSSLTNKCECKHMCMYMYICIDINDTQNTVGQCVYTGESRGAGIYCLEFLLRTDSDISWVQFQFEF